MPPSFKKVVRQTERENAEVVEKRQATSVMKDHYKTQEKTLNGERKWATVEGAQTARRKFCGEA